MKSIWKLWLLLGWLSTIVACQAQPQTTGTLSMSGVKAVVGIVMVDQVDQGIYMAGLEITEGEIAEGQYIEARGSGASYAFQVVEIQKEDQVVQRATTGQSVFVVLKAATLAPKFDMGFQVKTISKTAFETASQQMSSTRITEATASTDEVDGAAKVDFLINGIKAVTQKKEKDKDEHVALLNSQNKHLTINLLGDTPEQTRRGMLTITIPEFNGQAGHFPKGRVSFVRYKDVGGNTLASWSTTKGAAADIHITEVKENAENAVGQTFLIKGTFSGTLSIDLGYKTVGIPTAIKIEKGRFEMLQVQEMYKKK